MKRRAATDFKRLLAVLCPTRETRKVLPTGAHEHANRSHTPSPAHGKSQKPPLRLESLSGGRQLVPRQEDELEIHFQTLAKFWAVGGSVPSGSKRPTANK